MNKKDLLSKLHEVIDNVSIELMENASSGDITPQQAIDLDKNIANIANTLFEVYEQNNA